MSVSLQPSRVSLVRAHTAFHNLEPEKQHLMFKTPTSTALQDVLRHSCLAGDREPVGHVPSTLTALPSEPKQKQTEQLEEHPDLLSEPMSDEGILMQRQYKAQFQRLDKASNGRLEEEDLLAVMQSFYPGWELEDLPTVIHEVGRLHQRQTLHHGRSSPGAVAGVKSYHESMDFDGFVAMLSDDELIDGAETKGSVKRDVKILREALQAENNYNLYKDDGHWTQGAKKIQGPLGSMAVMVDVLPGIIIVINALVLGISSDFQEFHVMWQAFNIFFLAFYTLEFIVKVAMFGWKWFFLGDDWPWNYFDLFCVALSWVEEVTTWIVQSMNTSGDNIDLKAMEFIRMLRLTRLFRLVRTLRFEIFYELKMMVLGVVSGMRVLFWAMVLLIVIIYATGVAAKNMIGAVEPEFNTVPAAMFSIFRCFTDGCNAYDGTPLTERLRNNHGFLFIVGYTCMYMLVCLGVFNLIMAIFLENVMMNQMQRKLTGIDNTANRMEVNIKEELMRLALRSRSNGVPEETEKELKLLSESFQRKDARVRAMFEVLASAQVVITKPAFISWLKDRQFVAVLKEADIETANQAGIFECLDADMSGWLTLNEIYNGLMRLRGPVAKSEIVGFCLRLRHVAQIVHGMSD